MGWRNGQAYGQELRERVLTARGSLREVAARFAVSESYVARVRSRKRRLGEVTPGRQCSHRVSKLMGLEDALREQVAACNDLTLAQLCDWLQATHGVEVGITTMFKALARLGLTLKKSHCMPASRNVRT